MNLKKIKIFIFLKEKNVLNPSVSIKTTEMSSEILMGLPQIHIPFVHGLVEGPISNPL